MLLNLFHRSTHRVFRGTRGKKSPFGHSFGGSVDYSGLVASPGQPPVHLLFRLNLDDPAIGVENRKTQWLPLLCAIRYGACEVGYRVVSDNEVQILRQVEAEAWDEFPTEDYPEKLGVKPVKVEELVYDPDDPQDVLLFAGIFGYDHLSSEQFAKAVKFYVDAELYDAEIVEEDFGIETPEEYVKEWHCMPYEQGVPEEDCPDSSCSNHGKKSSLRTFAIFQESEKKAMALWGPNGENLQIVYQVCPECGAISTTNQCT